MLTDNKLFNSDPRDFALQLVRDGQVDAERLLLAALKYMSSDEVRGMLDSNELSPRFFEYDPIDAMGALNDFNYVGSRHHY
jgi:hypothetical protein